MPLPGDQGLLRPRADGEVVATYVTYAEAQRAVDHLSDEKFPVENLTIVGSDLRLVETVLGRMSWGRAVLGGAATGAWFGLFVGLLLGLFASSTQGWFSLMLWGLVYGALFGIVFGLVSYAFTRGRRDFVSTQSLVAGSYAVLATPEHAAPARALLAGLPAAEGS